MCLEILQNSQENTCARVSFLIKLQAWGLRPATFLKKRFWNRYFPVNFVKFLWTPFLENSSGRLLPYRNGMFGENGLCKILTLGTNSNASPCWNPSSWTPSKNIAPSKRSGTVAVTKTTFNKKRGGLKKYHQDIKNSSIKLSQLSHNAFSIQANFKCTFQIVLATIGSTISY